ncbi:hypothetical protein [Mesotoga sp.]|uniref:hypothetical protein n=1 Tax=Mesotoga sp. TaxID=2053577 RepID=UPI00345E7BA0
MPDNEEIKLPDGLFNQAQPANREAKKEKVQEKPTQKKDTKETETGIDSFIKSLELTYDENLVNNALEHIHVKLATGEEVTLGQYENLIMYKVVQYIKLGVGWKVTQMMRDQDKQGTVDKTALKWILKEMAEKELLYGLKPIEHVIPLDKNVYVGINGRKYFARNTGQTYSVEYQIKKDGNEDNVWDIDCILTVIDKEGNKSVYVGQGHASPSNVYRKDWIKDMAYKRSLADALESAFPIGASYEKAPMIQDFEESRMPPDQKPELASNAESL